MSNQSRHEDKDSLDDFPTPKWATRAFIAHCLPKDLTEQSVWEPCANRGYMVDVLKESFGTVVASDVADYGVGFPVIDFLDGPSPTPMDYGQEIDCIITNPPFNKSTECFERWMDLPIPHAYFLLRTNWLEGQGRYERVFKHGKLARVIQYVERVPIVRGRLDKDVSTNQPYAWFEFSKDKPKYSQPRVTWIPPCRKQFDKEEDWPNETV